MRELIAAVIIAVCGCPYMAAAEEVPMKRNMKPLTLRWERLVDEKSQTCERCGSTGTEVDKAYRSLKESLGGLGIEVVLETRALDPETCAKDVTQSNRIWIGGAPLEELLDATVGKSPCGFCCEELGEGVECRTITVDGTTYESIPEGLIVRAGLVAASRMVSAPTKACCPDSSSKSRKSSSCCPTPARGTGGCATTKGCT